MLKSD